MTKRRHENRDPVANGLLAALPPKEQQLLMNQKNLSR